MKTIKQTLIPITIAILIASNVRSRLFYNLNVILILTSLCKLVIVGAASIILLRTNFPRKLYGQTYKGNSLRLLLCGNIMLTTTKHRMAGTAHPKTCEHLCFHKKKDPAFNVTFTSA